MHKNLLLLPVLVALLISFSSPVSALEVIIDSTGKMTFYNDGILGDTTETEFKDEKQELDLKSEALRERHKEELRQQQGKDTEALRKRQAAEKEQLQKQSDALRKKELESAVLRKKERPLKEVSPEAGQQLRIKQQKAGVTVEVRGKNENELESVEEANPERLRVELPAELQAEDGSGLDRPEKVRQVLEERRHRIGEKIELRPAEQNGEESLEVRSREVTARVQSSTEMIIDPETNQMSVVKPNGEVAVITHLPDQAIDRLSKFGSLDGVDRDHGRQLELITTDDGKVIYKLTVPKKKKFLGFIDREVETEIELNDETGEVTEEAVPQSGFSSFLNALSF